MGDCSWRELLSRKCNVAVPWKLTIDLSQFVKWWGPKCRQTGRQVETTNSELEWRPNNGKAGNGKQTTNLQRETEQQNDVQPRKPRGANQEHGVQAQEQEICMDKYRMTTRLTQGREQTNQQKEGTAWIQTKLTRGWGAGGETPGTGRCWWGWCETGVRGIRRGRSTGTQEGNRTLRTQICAQSPEYIKDMFCLTKSLKLLDIFNEMSGYFTNIFVSSKPFILATGLNEVETCCAKQHFCVPQTSTVLPLFTGI